MARQNRSSKSKRSNRSTSRGIRPLALVLAGAFAAASVATAAPALASPASTPAGAPASTKASTTAGTPTFAPDLHSLRSRIVPPSAFALGYTDALDKLEHGGAKLGGLSSLAYDRRSAAWISAVDNHASDPSRIWSFRDLAKPTVVSDPLVLKKPDGTPYDGTTADNEGLAVLPDGDYLVSSETEPSIRIYGRDGIQKSSLPVPGRFAVAGTTLPGSSTPGEATSNATLEGLTISPSGHTIVAAMEGALSGDVSAAGDATFHRFLVYTDAGQGRWSLEKQIAYRTETGMRVPEVAAVSDDQFVVEEASFSATTGNAVDLYSVSGLGRATDVSRVADLSAAPAKTAVTKTLVADLVKGPSLGATALEPQANPLLDNFEGMAITGRLGRIIGVSLISDDNFSATQRTRIVNLVVKLP